MTNTLCFLYLTLLLYFDFFSTKFGFLLLLLDNFSMPK